MATQQAISAVKKGDYVQLKDGGPVYVRGEYDRSSKTYELQSFDDANRFVYRKASCLVFVDFTF